MGCAKRWTVFAVTKKRKPRVAVSATSTPFGRHRSALCWPPIPPQRGGWARTAEMTTDPCPRPELHADEPETYIGWHDWAAEMIRTHTQHRCPGCGRYKIWRPRPGSTELAK